MTSYRSPRDIIKRTKKAKTAVWYEQSLSSLCWYYNKDVIDVKEITSSRLNAYMDKVSESGGKNGKPLEPGSVSNYLGGLKSLFNKCRRHYNDDDLDLIRIPHDPFLKVKIPAYRKKRKNIDAEELKKIRDYQPATEREQIGRDLFMMLFYLMGINVNDFYNLHPPVAGRIEYARSKTDTDKNIHGFVLSVKIEPELQILIDKYSKTGFLSEIKARYCNSYNLMKSANKGLKRICAQLGIPQVTTNWARHTWASLARNKADISKADVDFCLGHVNHDYKMADIYIDIDYSIYDRANRQVLDLLVKRKIVETTKTSHLRVV
ncbi:MAG: tyrosine-type recombinase/integrase [Mangrovibacterium sp.]